MSHRLRAALLGFAAAALGVCLASLAHAQSTPVFQSGVMLPHNLAKFATNGLIEDASPNGTLGDNNGEGAGPFLIDDHLSDALCWATAKLTLSHHTACLGHNSSGTAIASVDGVDYTFPATGGTVMGPNPTVDKEIASFNGVTGTLLRQGTAQATDSRTAAITTDGYALAGLSQSGTPAQTVYNQAVFSGNATLFNGYDGLRGVTIAPALSTVNTIAGVAGYTLNNTVPIGQRSQTVALFGVGVCAVNSSDCWGVDTIVSDNPSVGNTGITAGTGKFITNEFDLNITSPNTTGNGLAIGGTALPVSTTLGINGVSVTKLWGAGGVGTGTSLFANGFIAGDACCATGMLIGVNALSGTSVTSMPLTFNYRDGAGVVQNETLAGFAGTLFVGGTASYGLKVSDGAGGDNALSLGAHLVSGTNVASHILLWNYFDAGAAAQNYNAQVNTSRTLVFAASVGNTVAKYDFEGGLQIQGSGVQVGVPTGGDKGAGTLNVQGTIWTNGTQGVASKTCTVNQALTLIFTNGILTGGSCVT